MTNTEISNVRVADSFTFMTTEFLGFKTDI